MAILRAGILITRRSHVSMTTCTCACGVVTGAMSGAILWTEAHIAVITNPVNVTYAFAIVPIAHAMSTTATFAVHKGAALPKVRLVTSTRASDEVAVAMSRTVKRTFLVVAVDPNPTLGTHAHAIMACAMPCTIATFPTDTRINAFRWVDSLNWVTGRCSVAFHCQPCQLPATMLLLFTIITLPPILTDTMYRRTIKGIVYTRRIPTYAPPRALEHGIAVLELTNRTEVGIVADTEARDVSSFPRHRRTTRSAWGCPFDHVLCDWTANLAWQRRWRG